MIGLVSCTNTELMEQIQERHPNGIYSQDDFLSRITTEETFFTVSSGESAYAYKGYVYVFKGIINCRKIRVEEILSYKRINKEIYLEDLFHKPKAIFFDENDLKEYIEDVNSNRNNLWGLI